MELSRDTAERLLAEGEEALRRGLHDEALSCFEALVAGGGADEGVWLLLAATRRASGDVAGEEATLNRLLEAQPHSISAHIGKGDCRARAADADSACSFYRRAVELAADRPLSPEASAELARAERALADLQARAHEAREARLAGRGLPPAGWSPRLRQALEIAAGRKKLYHQQPTAFTYPGLPHVQFYDPVDFPWAAAIEAAAPAIREELAGLLADGDDAFRAYIQTDASTNPLEANQALVGSKDWSVLALCENGWVAPEVVRRCPRTWEAVLQAPVPRVAGWGPTIVFSMLKAGAHIARHTGMYNTRLICHLPLIVPPGCRFRVGNEVREWQPGKLLIFDDTIEHEAWNDGPEDRVVLIFDIWRPELSKEEKHELTLLFSD